MVCGGTAAGTVPTAYCRKGDMLNSVYVPRTGCCGGSMTYVSGWPPGFCSLVKVGVAAAAGPQWLHMSYWGKGTCLFLLRVSALKNYASQRQNLLLRNWVHSRITLEWLLLLLPVLLLSCSSSTSSSSIASLYSALTSAASALAPTSGQVKVFEQLVPFLPVGGNSAVVETCLPHSRRRHSNPEEYCRS